MPITVQGQLRPRTRWLPMFVVHEPIERFEIIEMTGGYLRVEGRGRTGPFSRNLVRGFKFRIQHVAPEGSK